MIHAASTAQKESYPEEFLDKLLSLEILDDGGVLHVALDKSSDDTVPREDGAVSPSRANHTLSRQQAWSVKSSQEGDQTASTTVTAAAVTAATAPSEPVKTLKSAPNLTRRPEEIKEAASAKLPPAKSEYPTKPPAKKKMATFSTTTSMAVAMHSSTGGTSTTSTNTTTDDLPLYGSTTGRRTRQGPNITGHRPASAHPGRRPDLYDGRRIKTAPATATATSSTTTTTSVDYSPVRRGLQQRARQPPIRISPRPASAHPLRRPDLYGSARRIQTAPPTPSELQDDIEFDLSERSESPRLSFSQSDHQQRQQPKQHMEYSEPCLIKPTKKPAGYQPPSPSKEKLQKGSHKTAVALPEEKEVSFVVSLDVGEEPSEVISSPTSSSITSSGVFDDAANLSPQSDRTPTPEDLEDIITKTKRQSSIVEHTDSLDLIEQAMSLSHPQESSDPLSTHESQEMIEKRRRESSLVRHVDSLILIEQSKPELLDPEHSQHKVRWGALNVYPGVLK